MNDKAGVWIDHRKAIIVSVAHESERTVSVESHVEKHPERTGDSPLTGPYESQQVPADDSQQRALTGRLNGYYDSVIHALGSTDTLMIFGPGEAKTELRTRLLKNHSAVQIVMVEPADKMTEHQISAKIREYFGFGAERRHDAV